MPEIIPSKTFSLHQLFPNLRRTGVKKMELYYKGEKRNQLVSPLGPDLEKKNLI